MGSLDENKEVSQVVTNPPIIARARRRRSSHRAASRRAKAKAKVTAPLPSPEPEGTKKKRAPRKQGRKLTRDQFVDSVVIYEATGNRPNTWAQDDDWKRYIANEGAPSAEEKDAARKRCGL